MKQLIEIKTIPISIEMSVNNARIDRKLDHAEVEVTRNKKGLTIKSRPIKLNIDSFNARNTVFPTTATSIYQSAQKGKNAAYEATARIAEEGHMMVNFHLNQDPITEIASNRFMGETASYNIEFIPSEELDIKWEPYDIKIDYEMDKLNFEWQIGKADFNFVPASIEFNVKEYNRVIIEYVGEPIYIPESANPNYVEVDVKV